MGSHTEVVIATHDQSIPPVSLSPVKTAVVTRTTSLKDLEPSPIILRGDADAAREGGTRSAP